MAASRSERNSVTSPTKKPVPGTQTTFAGPLRAVA